MSRTLRDDPAFLFELRVQPLRGMRPIVIRAFEASGIHYGGTHTRIDVEVRHAGETIFPRGSLYCGIPSGHTIDGTCAKEAVLSLVAMKPGDTDRDYFDDYTERQLGWCLRYGEHLSCEAQSRYCDENGEVRR